jgi:hypothetical protein
VTEVIREETKNFIESNENENITYQNLWNTAKAVLRGKFIVIAIYNQLIFDKRAQNTQWRKDSLFNKCCWENYISPFRRLKLDPCLSLCTKITSKWIKDLNIRPKTLKQVQEAVGNTMEQICMRNNFLNRTQKAQHLRETMNKWDCIKLKSFCTAMETITRLKRQPTEWKKNFFTYSSGKGLIFRIYRELIKTQPSKNQYPNEERGT